MAISQSLNDAQVSLANVGYQLMPKELGALLEEVSTDFSLANVVTDTTTAYTARYRIKDTPLYLYLIGHYASSTYSLRVDLQHLQGTTYVSVGNTLCSVDATFSGVLYVAYATMGDFLSTLAISTSNGHHIYLSWGWFISEYTQEKIYAAYSISNASGALSTGSLGDGFAPFATSAGLLSSSMYTALPESTSAITVTTSSRTYGTQATTPTNSVAVFNPQHTEAYVTNAAALRWYGRILWGGLYILYILCTTSGAHYIVTPGNTYKIGESTVQAVFSNIIIPKEP